MLRNVQKYLTETIESLNHRQNLYPFNPQHNLYPFNLQHNLYPLNPQHDLYPRTNRYKLPKTRHEFSKRPALQRDVRSGAGAVWTLCGAVHSVSTATCFLPVRCLNDASSCLSPQDGQITPADSDRLLSAWLHTVKNAGSTWTEEHVCLLVCMGVKLGILYGGKGLGWGCSRKRC